MDILNKTQNLEKLFEYDKNDKLYHDYLEYLKLYYQKPNKNNKYDTSYDNGKLFLIDKKNKTKKIEINPSKYTDLDKLYNDLKLNIKIVLERISLIVEKTENYNDIDREEFKNLKEKYLLYNTKIIEIDSINEKYNKSIDILLTEKIELSNNLAKYYIERTNAFNNISKEIPKNIKNELIKIYNKNENKTPLDTDVNYIAKKYTIPSKIIEEWFQWIEKCYYYLITKKKVYLINDEIKKNQQIFEYKNKNMLLKIPEIIV